MVYVRIGNYFLLWEEMKGNRNSQFLRDISQYLRTLLENSEYQFKRELLTPVVGAFVRWSTHTDTHTYIQAMIGKG